MTTDMPAVVRASSIRALLASVGANDIPHHYTVCSIGVYNHNTGQLSECDTSPFYQAFGVNTGDNITIGATELTVSRHIIVHNDD